MSLHVRPRPRPATGFSLIELLVALAVFALVVLALLRLSGESTRTLARLEPRILAGLVADDVAAEALLVDSASLGQPLQGREHLAGREWPWQRRSQQVAGGLLRIEVTVFDSQGQHAAEAVLFR